MTHQRLPVRNLCQRLFLKKSPRKLPKVLPIKLPKELPKKLPKAADKWAVKEATKEGAEGTAEGCCQFHLSANGVRPLIHDEIITGGAKLLLLKVSSACDVTQAHS